MHIFLQQLARYYWQYRVNPIIINKVKSISVKTNDYFMLKIMQLKIDCLILKVADLHKNLNVNAVHGQIVFELKHKLFIRSI